MMRAHRAVFAATLCGVLCACTVGPDFHPPDAPATTRYTTTPLPPETVAAEVPGGQAQRFVEGRDIPAEWWTLFECEPLDAMVRQALQDSPSLAQIEAKLVKAQQDLEAHSGVRYPKIDAGASANRVDVNSGSFEGVPAVPVEVFPLTLYSASVRVSYTLDLFGKTRRELEALQATVDYQRYQLAAAQLMLAGNIVTAAIEEAGLRQEIDTTERIVGLRTRSLEIVQRLERLGGVPQLDVVTQQGELARTRATLPSLHERLDRTRNRLAVYLGQLPGEAALPEIRLADLKLPTELPMSVPSELARRRPDIQASEALLHEASARVGVATANLYPQITLSANAGSLTTDLSNLLSSGTGFSLLGGSLLQPLFHGGELRARKRSAVAAFEQAGGAYKEVVLKGFRDVADALSALDGDAKTLREWADAAAAARGVHDIASKRYEVGGVSLLSLLDAERQLLTASLEQTRAIADRYADSAALFQALGGGWWSQQAQPATAANGQQTPSEP